MIDEGRNVVFISLSDKVLEQSNIQHTVLLSCTLLFVGQFLINMP